MGHLALTFFFSHLLNTNVATCVGICVSLRCMAFVGTSHRSQDPRFGFFTAFFLPSTFLCVVLVVVVDDVSNVPITLSR
jgi:hypothetical protein